MPVQYATVESLLTYVRQSTGFNIMCTGILFVIHDKGWSKYEQFRVIIG